MKVLPTKLAGLSLVELDVYSDERGSFTEFWQAEKMEQAGLRPISPVQGNRSVNTTKGVLRGIHAEPWDKYISVAHGRVFAAIADLRIGSDTFGQVETFELDETKALFVPRGLGNSFQTLTDLAIYTYLVTAYYRPEQTPYPAVVFDDPDLAIEWPIWPPVVNDKDRANPTLRQAFPRKVKS